MFRAARRERIRFHQVYRRPTPESVEPDEPLPEPEPEIAPPPSSTRVRAFPSPAPVAHEQPAPPGRTALPAEHPVENEPAAQPVERVRHAPDPGREILKGYEYGKGQYVVLDPREIASLRARTSNDLEIVEFVHLDEIDPVYFDASYYLVPDAGGEKPYALLDAALRKTGYAALGTFAMHGREYATVIRAGRHGLLLHTLFYSGEIHTNDEYRTAVNEVAPQELELAEKLIRALAAPFNPEKFADTLEQRLHALIEEKAEHGLAPEPEAPARAAAPVIDILEALRKSLAVARKPAGRAEAPAERNRQAPRSSGSTRISRSRK